MQNINKYVKYKGEIHCQCFVSILNKHQSFNKNFEDHPLSPIVVVTFIFIYLAKLALFLVISHASTYYV